MFYAQRIFMFCYSPFEDVEGNFASVHFHALRDTGQNKTWEETVVCKFLMDKIRLWMNSSMEVTLHWRLKSLTLTKFYLPLVLCFLYVYGIPFVTERWIFWDLQ